MKRLAAIAVFCLCWGGSLFAGQPAAAAEAASPELSWKSLAPGLEMVFLSAEDTVRAGSGSIAVLRFDPAEYDFRVLASPRGSDGHNAEQWLERSGAAVVLNAGQYLPDGSYIGLLVRDGVPAGRLAANLEGLFVADPDDASLTRARVLDLRYTAYDPQRSPYRQAAQSLMLLDRFGQIRVRRSARVAHRTAVAQDRKNRILFIVTLGGHTLWELADFSEEIPSGPPGGHVHGRGPGIPAGGRSSRIYLQPLRRPQHFAPGAAALARASFARRAWGLPPQNTKVAGPVCRGLDSSRFPVPETKKSTASEKLLWRPLLVHYSSKLSVEGTFPGKQKGGRMPLRKLEPRRTARCWL